MNLRSTRIALPALVLTTFLAACDDDPTAPVANDQELITDVVITLTPVGGGTAIVSTIADPDGPGPNPPNAQDNAILLVPGTYDGTIEFFDRSDPAAPEDITAALCGTLEQVAAFVEGLPEGAYGAPMPDCLDATIGQPDVGDLGREQPGQLALRVRAAEPRRGVPARLLTPAVHPDKMGRA